MSFIDEFSEKASKYVKIIGDEAEKFVDKSVNHINIHSKKEKISKLYQKLGKYVYDNRGCLGEYEIEAIICEIDAETNMLEQMIAKHGNMEQFRVCSCGYKTKAHFEYCPKCGRKF